MKNALLLSFLISFLILPEAAWSSQTQYALKVDGLACPFCSYGIEKQLMRLEGVREAATDLDQGRVVVTMTDNQELTEEAAREAVDAAGFTLRGFERIEGDDDNG